MLSFYTIFATELATAFAVSSGQTHQNFIENKGFLRIDNNLTVEKV